HSCDGAVALFKP
ncbi:Hypothetical protein, putative, partial [Bodo saltans]